ncbi:hypothetical protein GYMLUDRAFT_247393 [Collybiopsis luxurians FD-317 M1]|uniref:Uncharacterized protein n=1 Tax=Collybiopsis luxurians FD-317 M1 TaxID=944289 RepID=A0A0D0B178_9AGAR|nr:hypothetical protein GYMLUDRAFT_247393 [Collybiopsis luxurians FD-317 M1]
MTTCRSSWISFGEQLEAFDQDLFQIPGPHIDQMCGIEDTAECLTILLIDARLELLKALMALRRLPLDVNAHQQAKSAAENSLEIVRTLLKTIVTLQELCDATSAPASQLTST